MRVLGIIIVCIILILIASTVMYETHLCERLQTYIINPFPRYRTGDIIFLIGNRKLQFPKYPLFPIGHLLADDLFTHVIFVIIIDGEPYAISSDLINHYDYLTGTVKKGVTMVKLRPYLRKYSGHGVLFHVPFNASRKTMFTGREDAILTYVRAESSKPYEFNPLNLEDSNTTFCSKLVGGILVNVGGVDPCVITPDCSPPLVGDIKRYVEQYWCKGMRIK